MSKLALDDFINFSKIESLDVSNSSVIWVEKKSNSTLSGYNSHIKLMDLSERVVSDIAFGKSPKFYKNQNNILYISEEDNSLKIYDHSSKEEKVISKNGHKVTNFWISPEFSKIMYSSVIDRSGRELSKYDDPRVITELVYRSGTTYISEQTAQQLFVIVQSNEKITQVTDLNNHYFQANWLDENNIITYYHKLEQSKISDYKELVKINVEDLNTELVSKLYNPYYFLNHQIYTNPFNSSEIYTQVFESDYPKAMRAQIIKIGEFSKEPIELMNKEFDRSITYLEWIESDKALVLVIRNGFQEIMEFDKSTKKFVELYQPDTSVDSFVSSNGKIFAITTEPKKPSAIQILENGEFQVIHDPNAEFLLNKELCEPTVYWFKNNEGKSYQGWFFEPRGSTAPYKTILSIHGGPHVMWTNAGTMWFEWQTQVANGYAVLALNPVGSDGYGEEFLRVICGDWGKTDAIDLLMAVDQLIDMEKIQMGNIFVCGGSYAGFQTVNLIAKTNRFNAACAQRGVYNLLTLDAGSDIARFDDLEYIGPSNEKQLDKLWNDSPISKVDQITTPLLLIHSELDFRVPISQADHLFAELRRRSKTVEYVRYPREGHELSRGGEPKHIIDRLKRIVDWFDKYNSN